MLMSDDVVPVHLRYGASGEFRGRIQRGRLIRHHQPFGTVVDVASAAREALAHPLEFPDLARTIMPDDSIVIASRANARVTTALLVELWRLLDRAGVAPQNVTVLTHVEDGLVREFDPRSSLPDGIRERMHHVPHDPAAAESCGYLGRTASGERVFLARELIDADIVIPVGSAGFDPLLGYRGGAGALFPAFSNAQMVRRGLSAGHDELLPSDTRPLRQVADEVGLLLGVQFVINVLPGPGTGIRQVLAGQCDAVMREAQKTLDQMWFVELDERVEMVLVTVESDPSESSWESVAAAIDAARRIVVRDGRIMVLTQLEQPLSTGLEILRRARTPKDALRPIRETLCSDLLIATQVALAADRANIYLLSHLQPEIVEELFMIPIESEAEVQRILETDDSTVIIENAQHAFAVCRPK